jgi:hypothetical protein
LKRTIGRYEIQRELGRGMMGVVYEAHDPSLGRTIALKTIHLSFTVAPEAQKSFEDRFLAEAKAAARLSHPGIVVVHDVGQDPATKDLYIALEHLPGVTADQIVGAGQPMPWRQAMLVVQRVAEALHHAHERGVIHRDVKPANIMILPSGAPKIMDFGIAKVDATQLTAAGEFFGTPLYMAPEQVHGRPLDARSDLFSLGSVAYALLTGRHAFAGTGLPHIISQVTGGQPPPPSSLVAGIPPSVDSVIARALAKDPTARYQDGQAMAEDIEDTLAGRPLRHGASAAVATAVDDDLAHLLDDVPLMAVEPAPPARAIPPLASAPASRSKVVPLAVLAATVVAVLAGGVVWRGRLRPPAAEPLPAGGPVARRVPVQPPEAPRRSSTQPAPVADEPSPAPDTPARLAIDFEHSLRSGTLRVWVDEALILEEPLSGLVTRKLASVRFRKGRLEDQLEVAPGRHEVKVEVAWDDDVKTESIWADFEPGSSRRLAARFGGLGGLGIKKKLSLEWE